jgi:hypothetical protein
MIPSTRSGFGNAERSAQPARNAMTSVKETAFFENTAQMPKAVLNFPVRKNADLSGAAQNRIFGWLARTRIVDTGLLARTPVFAVLGDAPLGPKPALR